MERSIIRNSAKKQVNLNFKVQAFPKLSYRRVHIAVTADHKCEKRRFFNADFEKFHLYVFIKLRYGYNKGFKVYLNSN